MLKLKITNRQEAEGMLVGLVGAIVAFLGVCFTFWLLGGGR